MAQKVLIADDAIFMRMMLKDIILKIGMEVVGEAENGKQAVAKYKELQPDIVTLDITMPEQDGVSALQEILTLNPKAKVIMISATGQQTKVTEALTKGAKDFIVKPFNPERVLETLKKYL